MITFRMLDDMQLEKNLPKERLKFELLNQDKNLRANILSLISLQICPSEIRGSGR